MVDNCRAVGFSIGGRDGYLLAAWIGHLGSSWEIEIGQLGEHRLFEAFYWFGG